MKLLLNLTVSFILFGTLFSSNLDAQSMSKKYRIAYAERIIQAPAEKVWEVMVTDYGEISNFAPSIKSSFCPTPNQKAEVGAERECTFNDKGTRWTRERIAMLDNEKMIMRNRIIEAGKFPLDIDNSQAFYRVRDNGDGTSTASYEFQFRAKPAIMGFLMHNKFKQQLNETLIGLDHYVVTGEKVNSTDTSWNEIQKKYKENGTYKGTHSKSL